MSAATGPETIESKIEKAKDSSDALHKLIAEVRDDKELNEASAELIKKEKVTKEIKEKVREKLKALKAEENINEYLGKTDEQLVKLQNRLHIVKLLQVPLTNSEKLQSEYKVIKDKTVEYAKSAWDGVKKNVLEPIVNNTKDVPILGSVIGMIKDLDSRDVVNWLQRKYYELLASPASILGEGAEKKWYGGWITKISNDAKKELMILDAQDAIKEAEGAYKITKIDGTVTNVTIALDKAITPEEQKAASRILVGDVTIGSLINKEARKQRDANNANFKIRLGSLFDTKTPEQLKQETDTTLKTKMLTLEPYETAKITSVDFSTTETSIESGVLKINPTDIDTDGKVKPGTKGEALFNMKKTLTNATKIIVTDAGDKTILDWSDGKKVVKIPINSTVDQAKINTYLSKERQDYYSILEIGNDDNIPKDGIEIIEEGGKKKLKVRNSEDTLSLIESGKASNLQSVGKYKKSSSSDFEFIPPPVPAK